MTQPQPATPNSQAADPASRPADAAPGTTGRRERGAPKGNKNAQTHGLYSRQTPPLETIDDAIAHLGQALGRLDAYITDHAAELTVDELTKLASVYGVNLSRFVRMLRDTAGAKGKDADQLDAAIEEALALAAAKLGADLEPL